MRMHPFRFFILSCWLLLMPAEVLWAQPANPVKRIQTVEQLREQLAAHLDDPKFSAATWSVKVVSLDSGKTIFEHHADRLMSPASNSKLYTGALVLARLGGDYRFETPVYAAGKISRSGTLQGDLVVLGHGDPSWNQRRLGTNFWTIFEPFVAILTNAGVCKVNGDVVADATYFRGEPTGSSWTIDDLRDGETGMITALTVDDNIAQVSVAPGARAGEPCQITPMQPGTDLIYSNKVVTVASDAPARLDAYRPLDGKTVYIFGQLPAGGAAQSLDVVVPRPADWFAAALKLALAQHGIKVTGHTRGLIWPQSEYALNTRAARLGTVFSPPLREVVRNFMKPSQNLEADTLLADVGETARGTNTPSRWTSEEAGLGAMKDFLSNAGVSASDVHFDEGSGLSRDNLTTANATVALLQYMEHHREGRDFIDALPVAGVDGTLRRRYHDTPAAGNVRAKTGTLRWAQAQSGYVTTAAGERLAFSIMLNRYVAGFGHSGHDEIVPLVVMLANLGVRSDELSANSYAPLGTLVMTQFVNAPFPHPARAEGHSYHEEFYSTPDHYMDSTVAMFIPAHFRVSDKIDFVVHFHGWRHKVAGTLDEYELIKQFSASGKNAILVVPQGPLIVPDSFDGKLEDTNGFKLFMAEAVDKLRASGVLGRQDFDLGNIIISGHSGGYHVMAAIVDHGGLSEKIREVWLFDALYAGTENFVRWQMAEPGRLIDIYTDHGGTREESLNLIAKYKSTGVTPDWAKVGFFVGEEPDVVPQNLLTNKIIILHTDLVHNDVVSKRGEFEEFLKTSCLQNE